MKKIHRTEERMYAVASGYYSDYTVHFIFPTATTREQADTTIAHMNRIDPQMDFRIIEIPVVADTPQRVPLHKATVTVGTSRVDYDWWPPLVIWEFDDEPDAHVQQIHECNAPGIRLYGEGTDKAKLCDLMKQWVAAAQAKITEVSQP